MVTTSRSRWVLLAYHLPREPSTPRIALWRKLRRLGAVQLQDGLVALPLDARTRERLEWLAEEVTEAGGRAAVWLAEPATAAQERALARRMAAAVAGDYQAVTKAAQAARSLPAGLRRRTLDRLRRELRRVGLRDHFPPPQREQARAAVSELAATLSQPTTETEAGVGR
jgi:ChrB-like protein